MCVWGGGGGGGGLVFSYSLKNKFSSLLTLFCKKSRFNIKRIPLSYFETNFYTFIVGVKSLLDLCMEESTCIEMVIHLSQRFSSMLCLYCFGFLHFFISFKYDFHV